MVGVTDRSPLAQLVDEVCQANGWSRREVSRRAQAHGRSLSASRLGQLVSEYPLGGIQADKIDDLAIGLGISRDRVAVAVVQAMGFRIQDTSISVAEAIRRDSSLPRATKDALLAILRTAPRPTHNPRGDEHGQRSAPMTQPDAVVWSTTGSGKTATAIALLREQLDAQFEAAKTDRERADIQRLIDQLEEASRSTPVEASSDTA